MSPSSAIARCFQRPWLVFALVFAWKIALFVATVQPVPSNDSFFYDGPVVNFLNGGDYCNPQIALALPISGTEVFCAYPPLYQAVLLAWMALFGTGVVAAMGLHLALFGLYLLALLGIFRRLNTPAVWINFAGLFLFVNTFHDRPDSLAHWLGVSAIYAWVRARSGGPRSGAWDWLAAALIVLTLSTSLQFGGIYFGCLWVLAIGNGVLRGEKIPWRPLAATILIPTVLVALVKFGYPRLWQGFREHAAQTPGITGLRAPSVAELLKALRTLPGVGVAVCLLVALWRKRRVRVTAQLDPVGAVVLFGALAGVAAITAAGLTYLSPNYVLAAGYLQPLLVGIFLAAFADELSDQGQTRFWPAVFVALAALGSIRAVGMTTWGAACAADVSEARAMKLVSAALDATPPGSTVAVSAAYLYEAVHHKQVRVLHPEWLAPARRAETQAEVILALRPAKMILTQFDLHRFYGKTLLQLQAQTNVVAVKLINTARTPVPDASRRLQRVVQHISWSPVIVELDWHGTLEKRK